jgi:hypothetical protein
VFINVGDLGGRDTGILELECGTLLAAEDDDVLAFDADGASSCREREISSLSKT